MPRPKGSVDPEKTRERILSAAEHVFGNLGFQAATLTEIAAMAGMRAPSLLYHFASKESLFDDVIRRAYRALEEQIFPVIQDGGAGTTVFDRLLESLRVFEHEHSELFRALNAELLSQTQRGHTAIRDTLIPLMDRVEALIRENTERPIPPNAPLRQVLLYILSAHAVRSNMGAHADELWGAADKELEVAMTLLTGLLEWQEPQR